MINFLSITRQTANLTQQDVSVKLAVSIVTVRKMEDTEKIKTVSYGSVIAYCQLLGIGTIEVPPMKEKIETPRYRLATEAEIFEGRSVTMLNGDDVPL